MSQTTSHPVDLDEALERVGDDRELLSELFSLFRDDIGDQIAGLKAAAASSNKDDLVALSHAIKGASASLAAGAIREAAADIEESARDDQFDGMDAKLARLEHSVREFLEFIGTFK